MTCTITKDKLTKTFIDKNVLNPGNLKIRDKYAFNDLNDSYAEFYNDRFNLEDNQKPFLREGMKAVPNEAYLSTLDKIIYPELAQTERLKSELEAIKDDSKSSEKQKHNVVKTSMINDLEARFKKIYSKLDQMPDAYEASQKDSIDTTQAKIERMQEVFDAVVLIDRDLDASGALLSANHPLTKANGKPVILINPDMLFDDTVFHEFGHLYIELLGGLQDPVVAQAVTQLRKSILWNKVAKKYPELSDEDLAKEVLATALGFEGNKIYKDDYQENIWQRIKNMLVEALGELFNYINPADKVQRIASEMLSGKTRHKPGAKFNALINQYRRFKIEKPTQRTILERLDELTKKFKLNDETHEYVDVDENISFDTSVSSVAKGMLIDKSAANSRGDFNIIFDDTYKLNKENIEGILTERYIPMALENALTAYVEGRLDKEPPTISNGRTHWADFLAQEKAKSPKNHEAFNQALLEAIDVINKDASIKQDYYSKPAVMGTYIHEALENYVNALQAGDPNPERFIPENIKDKKGVLLKHVTDIVKEGMARGSVFVTEQILFSDTAKVPGTADMIEITKEGRYRIYDFKTTGSLTYYDGELKNKNARIVRPGYLNQLMIYGAIMEEYGIKSVDENPFNIIHIEVNRDNFDSEDPDNSDIEVTGTLLDRIDPMDPEISTDFRNSEYDIIKLFYTPEELKQFNIEDSEIQVKNTIEKILRGIEDYKKLTNSDTGKFIKNTEKLSSSANKLIKELEKDMEKYIDLNNVLAIQRYIDNMHHAIEEVYSEATRNKATLSAGYVQNMEYLLQLSEFIDEVKEYVEKAGSNFASEHKTQQDFIDIIDSTKRTINQMKSIHKVKSKEMAIRTLASHSNYNEGLMMERFELEARKEGHTSKSEIYKFVYKKLQEKKSQINSGEVEFWKKKFRDGYTDLRGFEHWLADPGMNSSQFVQVVKNILDKVDYAIRYDLDRNIPEIVKWTENLGFDLKGDPKKIWEDLLETATYEDENGESVSYTHGSVISKHTSKAKEVYLKYSYQIENVQRRMRDAFYKGDDKLGEELKEELDTLYTKQHKDTKAADNTITENPKYKALSAEKKAALDFIHKRLIAADSRLIGADKKRLVKTPGLLNGIRIYNLPKSRKTHFEAIHSAGETIRNIGSKIQDIFRPPADEDELNIQDSERGDSQMSVGNTDVSGNPSFNIPVFYRNTLDDPNMQSFDIPTLLALNDETTIAYHNKKHVEADLYMIMTALKEKSPDKTDSVKSGKLIDRVKGGMDKVIKSEDNKVLDNIKSSIEDRFYKRSYRGSYNKLKYFGIRSAELLSSYTSKLLLAGNFRSAIMTGLQGSIYRIVEGFAEENFTRKDVAVGTKKAYGDLNEIVADTQSHFPNSKTNLLMRRFGLDTQYKALANKFVQNNILSKNLDESSLFAVTTMSETMVTASLMYSMMNNIKVMNEEGLFIDKDGKVVSREKAMSLDEAYEVVDGKLEINPNVVFTEHNFNKKFVEQRRGDNTDAATEVSRYIRSLYADMFGQYNQELKSKVEMTIAGKMAVSMRKWFMRGMHRRWRGVTSTNLTFEELREDDNLDRRFYSQDQKKFQEGYYATGLRYLYSLKKSMKGSAFGWASIQKNGTEVYSTMNTHERANITRLMAEAVVIGTSIAMSMIAMMIVAAMDDEDDEYAQDKIYFLAYLAERLKMESITFIWLPELFDMAKNPAAAMNTFGRVMDLFDSLIGFTVDDQGDLDFNIDNRYERGARKGELKLTKSKDNLLYGLKNWEQFKAIFGFESDERMEDTYKYLKSM